MFLDELPSRPIQHVQNIIFCFPAACDPLSKRCITVSNAVILSPLKPANFGVLFYLVLPEHLLSTDTVVCLYFIHSKIYMFFHF